MPETTLSLTNAAAARIRTLAAADPAVGGLRIAVEGGGCSGFQYDIKIAPGPEADDFVVENGGAKLFVDSLSAPFLAGSVVDWTEELIGSSFRVKNPNAKSACGCGVSFSV